MNVKHELSINDNEQIHRTQITNMKQSNCPILALYTSIYACRHLFGYLLSTEWNVLYIIFIYRCMRMLVIIESIFTFDVCM